MKTQKINEAISSLKALLSELEGERDGSTILIAGLRFAKVNLGTDMDNPNGKYYTWDEALEACPDGWRLPTDAEHNQLVERTTQEIVVRDGVRGMLFTDNDTRGEMFLPAAGCRSARNGSTSGVGGFGYYWSSTRSSSPRQSYFLYFGYDGDIYPSFASYHSPGFSARYIKK